VTDCRNEVPWIRRAKKEKEKERAPVDEGQDALKD
jgi:hypothetical protein